MDEAASDGVPGVTPRPSAGVVVVVLALLEEAAMGLFVKIGWMGARTFGVSVFAAMVLGILCAGLGTIAMFVGFAVS
jgi:hypothetical protein